MKTMVSKYPGKCRACGYPFAAGSQIKWGAGVTLHANCQTAFEAQDRDHEAPDWETVQRRRDAYEYQLGRAQGEVRQAERRLYGAEMVEQFDLQDELNAYNRGDVG